jgi:predicted nucleic acid-binding protein
MLDESLTVTVLKSVHFRAAARFADQHKLDLRAGDALHLAVASDESATLCTLDKRLANTGKALGIATKLI